MNQWGEAPPRIRNLVRLAENTELSMTEEQLIFLADTNDFNIETRYPDNKFSFYKTCRKREPEKVERFISQATTSKGSNR